jgi:hypothetical protein
LSSLMRSSRDVSMRPVGLMVLWLGGGSFALGLLFYFSLGRYEAFTAMAGGVCSMFVGISWVQRSSYEAIIRCLANMVEDSPHREIETER